MLARLFTELSRLRYRLLVVNLVVVLVPVAGIEFARLFELEGLRSLERDMRNQAVLVRRFVEAAPRMQAGNGYERHESALMRAATRTRTRIRLLDAQGVVQADSHRHGPPEGEEVVPDGLGSRSLASAIDRTQSSRRWSAIADRREVREALDGRPSAYTRVREREPSVFLFLTEPIRRFGKVEGVVYVVRSTTPVMQELYRVRRGLQSLLFGALGFTLLVTLMLAWSISRPLERLAHVARQIARGQHREGIPVSGSGEVRELGLALRTMTEKLQAQLHATAAFAADVAHAFKSPLTSLRGAAELLNSGAAEDPEARTRFLRNIELDTARLDHLVSRLLELSRIEASDEATERVDLEQLVKDCAERSTQPDVRVEVDYRAGQRHARVQKTALQTALLNLLDNAVRYSPAKACVSVTVSESAEKFEIAIRDRGPGIDPALRARVFERFFTTEGDRDGTGLGLAIAQTVARAHGGDVVLQEVEAPGVLMILSVAK